MVKPYNKNKDRKPKRGAQVEVKYPQPTGNAEKDKELKNKAFNNALRKFKKMVSNEGIIQEYREKEFYEKPSDRRRKEKAMAKKRWQKKQKEMRQERGW